jgi:hypothetical protein
MTAPDYLRDGFLGEEMLLVPPKVRDALGQKPRPSVRKMKARQLAATTSVEANARKQAKQQAARQLLELGGRIQWGLDPDA